MVDEFEVAIGTITGRSHTMISKNNQDAYCLKRLKETIIAVVCDGCSEGKHSEVGAKIGSRLVAESIAKTFKRFIEVPFFAPQIIPFNLWEIVKQDVLAQLRVLANAMGDNLVQTVIDYFLFTTIGVIVTSTNTALFSFGDGVFVINGEIIEIGPFSENAPPYLAYGGLVETDLDPELLKFKVHWILPTKKVRSILVGTDGVGDLIKVGDRKIPGKEESVGKIDQFWEEDLYFRNIDAIRRRLATINSETKIPDWKNQVTKREVGLLPDDTTMIVIRRKGGEKDGGISERQEDSS